VKYVKTVQLFFYLSYFLHYLLLQKKKGECKKQLRICSSLYDCVKREIYYADQYVKHILRPIMWNILCGQSGIQVKQQANTASMSCGGKLNRQIFKALPRCWIFKIYLIVWQVCDGKCLKCMTIQYWQAVAVVAETDLTSLYDSILLVANIDSSSHPVLQAFLGI